MVSIIVPVYRAENWLRECVDSILAQTCGDWELLLIDDGSPDGCGGICDGYSRRDSRIRVLHQENRGPAAARNAGLAMARGDYITFCDADDAWERDHLHALLEGAKCTGTDVVSCNYQVVDVQGRFLRQSKYGAGEVSLKTQKDRVDYMLHQVLGWRTGWEVWSRLFSAELIRRYNIRFPETCGHYGEDLAFVLTVCLYANTLCTLEGTTYRYRVHPASITAKSKAARNVNALNEAAREVWQHYETVITEPRLREQFPLLHYCVLRGAWEEIPAADFSGVLENLSDKTWFFLQVRSLLRQKKALRCRFGRREAGRMVSWAKFCIHGNPMRFRLEKGLLTGDGFRKIWDILRRET